MWRKNLPDPYGIAELKRIILETVWARMYVKGFARQYSEVFTSPTDIANKQGTFTMSLARRFFESLLGFVVRTESPIATRRGCSRSQTRLCIVL